MVLDKFLEKFLESAASAYIPKLELIAQNRANELVAMKKRVRTCPEEVEAWFDKEIAKVSNVDVTELMEKMKKSYTEENKDVTDKVLTDINKSDS
jgi:hypothetical protein